MNKIFLIGRLTRDPDVRYSPGQNGEQYAISRFCIAVDRRFANKNQDNVTADFFNCVAFGKIGEFVDRYLRQGIKVVVTGRIENDNYTNKNGEKVYSVRVVTEEIEFAESKSSQTQNQENIPEPDPSDATSDGFMNIPEGIENDLPFK